MAAVNNASDAIKHIWNPTINVQLLAVGKNPLTIASIKNPDHMAVKKALTTEWILEKPQVYDRLVTRLFKDNALLMKKWLRYGETMRSQE
jgi:hypothetical protein